MRLKNLDALNKPYTIYAEVLESGAIDQFVSCMSLPDVVQGALMPDAHQGYVLPIGAVVATQGTIYPSFVGYDIGCGMSSTQLDVDARYIDQYAQQIYDAIRDAVPVGFSKNNTPQVNQAMGWQNLVNLPHTDAVKDIVGYGAHCLGTLGGGNHFIEIGKDQKDQVWVTIHSGSRSVGHGIADYYMKLAAESTVANFFNPESACALDINSQAGQDYIKDMTYGLQFALTNRQLMTHRILVALSGVLGFKVNSLSFINRNHNHAELKDGLWIHRKGATHAEKGMMGVIPGNMRDGCFIVKGLGNPDSLCSSSHGAGRVLSRSKAKKLISLEQFQEAMKDIPMATVNEKTVDESPFAYKDIFRVMELQEDLVEVVEYVKPLINIKG